MTDPTEATQAERAASAEQDRIEALTARTIKGLAMDAVQKANSGHPGAPMGMADIATVLWNRFLRYDPADAQWPDRDRLVLSNGHASMLLYAMLHLSGSRTAEQAALSLDDRRAVRPWGRRTAGPPRRGAHGQRVSAPVRLGLSGQELAPEALPRPF